MGAVKLEKTTLLGKIQRCLRGNSWEDILLQRCTLRLEVSNWNMWDEWKVWCHVPILSKNPRKHTLFDHLTCTYTLRKTEHNQCSRETWHSCTQDMWWCRFIGSSGSPYWWWPPRICSGTPTPSQGCGSLMTRLMTRASWECDSSASSWMPQQRTGQRTP